MKLEKKLNNSPEPVSISGTKTILNQLMNCICKLILMVLMELDFFVKYLLKIMKQKYSL